MEATPSDDPYCIGENRVWDAGAAALAHSLWSRRSFVAPPQLASLLASPGTPVLEEALAAAVPADTLRLLKDSRALLRRSELMERLRAGGPEGERPTVASLGVVTANRPDSLISCVSGFADNLRRHGRTIPIKVVDDSGDLSLRRRSREALQALARTRRVDVRYAGLEEKERFVDVLARRGAAPPDLLRFAMVQADKPGRRYGANRNALLLATAGEPFITLDDDILCRMAPHPHAEERTSFVTPRASIDIRFLGGAEVPAVAFVEGDFVEWHERLLGRPLAALARAAPVEWAPSERLLRAIRRNDGRVIATSTGIVGDSGIGGSHWYYFFLTDAALGRLILPSREVHEAATGGRRVFRATRSFTLAADFWMSGCAGLDNRMVLPPFFPFGRNEDAVFMTAVLGAYKSAFVGHLPMAVGHEPPEARPTTAAQVSRGLAPHVSNVLIGLLGWAMPKDEVVDGEAAFPRLGRALLDAAADEGAFAELVRDVCWSLLEGRLQRLSQVLSLEAPFDGWRRDVEAHVGTLRALARDGSRAEIFDLHGAGQAASAGELRQAIVDYGRLLRHWSDIVSAARDLGESEGALVLSA